MSFAHNVAQTGVLRKKVAKQKDRKVYKMGYKRLMQDIESGKITYESGLLKKIALKVEKELSDPQLLMKEPHRKMILHTFDYAQEQLKKEAEALTENDGTFYRDMTSEPAMIIIQDITANADCCDRAMKMIELFINNLMTVEEIEMILY